MARVLPRGGAWLATSLEPTRRRARACAAIKDDRRLIVSYDGAATDEGGGFQNRGVSSAIRLAGWAEIRWITSWK